MFRLSWGWRSRRWGVDSSEMLLKQGPPRLAVGPLCEFFRPLEGS